ncbi:MAG: hypothetical protein IPO92_01925 [Saprospiraceae bacterium]|nr:hypothetical protein [Saprospiraceae bacterium]
MAKLLLTIGNIFCLIIFLNAQSNLSIGEWKSHLAYKDGLSVTQSKDKVIYASQRGLFTIDKEDLSIDFFSKENGLSDVNISKLSFDKKNEQLIIVYKDNNIDIMKGSDVINIPFIKTSNSVLGSKTINDIFISQEEIYFATDFGVLGFDPKKLEFAFTTYTNLEVQSVVYHDGFIYAGTIGGLYKIAVKGTNLSDFNSWKFLSSTVGLPNSYTVNSLAVWGNTIFALINNKVYKLGNDGLFTVIFAALDDQENINFISGEGTSLMVGVEDMRNISRTFFIDVANNILEGGAGCINKAIYSIEDEKGRIWYADLFDPIRYTETKTMGCKKLIFPVPFANSAGEVTFKDNVAYISSGGVTEDYQYNNTKWGIYLYKNQIWENINQDNVPLMANPDFNNIQAIAPHPETEDIFIGSYYNGIIRYNPVTKDAQLWNKNNSILQGVVGDESRTRISSLVFDKQNNLWISNYGSPKPLAVKTDNDSWYAFNTPGATSLADIVVDHEGNKWIAVVGVGNGLLVFNEGDNLEDPTDDKSRYITKNNSEIIGNKVNCLVVDLEGSIWVGTSEGPVVFDCGDPFNEVCRGNTRKVIVDNIPALLLKDEDILSIEVDGGNRKWFGTRNGIFVQSPDGITQEMKFDVKNSPLLDNKVTELSFNAISGEMFITSAGGIQSYKTETTTAGNSFSSNVYAFPNPVRPDYNGPIAITGLVRDANVKITDISGKLIYETKALGGQAIWDGKDYNGVKASTGVYLVFSANENTSKESQAFVTKILVVN